jgi:ABC-2 type transport system permease protein
MTTLVVFLMRQQRARVLAWLIPLALLVAITAPSYAATYPALSDRQVLIETMRTNLALKVFYGVLPTPGTLGQLLTFETGAYVMVLGCLMALLLAVRLSRASEDAGTLELVRSCGVSPGHYGAAVLLVVGLVSALLGALVSAVLALQVGHVAELTGAGAASFGAVVAIAAFTVGVLALICAHLMPDATTARWLAMALLAASFALRAVADTSGNGGLLWFSPLGWKALVAPYAGDHVLPLAAFLACAAGLVAFERLLGGRRELGAGYIRPRGSSDRRGRARSPFGLAARLSRAQIAAWSVGMTLLGALFGGLSSGLVSLMEKDRATSELMQGMTGQTSPVSSYFAFVGLIVGITGACYVVVAVGHAARDERAGLVDLVLTTGQRRWEVLAGTAVVAALGSLIQLAAAGATAAAITAALVRGDHAPLRALGYILGQWPACLALTGAALLILAVAPRWQPLAWAPLAASATVAMLGKLLRVPTWGETIAVFGHAPDLAASAPTWTSSAWLAAAGLGAFILSLVAEGRRDVATG